MHLAVMDKGSIGRENRRFDRRAFALEAAPIERNVNDVFEVQIDSVGSQCVGESIERLLRRELEFSDNTYDFVNSRLIYQAPRPPDEQPNVFVKLEIIRKFRVVYPK